MKRIFNRLRVSLRLHFVRKISIKPVIAFPFATLRQEDMRRRFVYQAKEVNFQTDENLHHCERGQQISLTYVKTVY